MRHIIVVLTVMLYVLGIPQGVFGMDYITTNVYSEYIDIVQDTHFMSGVMVDVDAVRVHESLMIENDASILGDIYLCDGCNVGIRNAGSIAGVVHIGLNAELIQLISNPEDMTYIAADAPYTVFVDGVHGLNWNELYALGAGAGTLILNDTSVVFAGNAPMVMAMNDMLPRIELHGVITVELPDDFVAGNNSLLQNVSGDANIFITGGNPGDLYLYAADVHDSEMYIHLVRETDYYKILGDGRGLLLNRIRATMPNDALLRRLDTASNMDEINHIISHSAAFNPIRLMQPVRMLDAFMGGGIRMDLRANNRLDGRARPFYIWADDWEMYGTSADFIAQPMSGLVMGMSLYGAMLNSDDDINTFSGQLFGGRIVGLYDNEFMMARFSTGVTRADFDVPYIFDGDNIRTSAHGAGVYAVIDLGPKYGMLAPYVGAEYHMAQILGHKDIDVNGRSGLEVSVDVRGTELFYEYKLVAGLNTSSALASGLGVGITSYDDMLGMDVAINVLRDDEIFSWMLSVSARALF